MTVHPSFLAPGLPTSEPIRGKTVRADGWAYIQMMDFPSPVSLFEELEAIAGEGEMLYIYIHDQVAHDGGLVRLAMFVLSPRAQKRTIAFLNQRQKTRDQEVIIQ